MQLCDYRRERRAKPRLGVAAPLRLPDAMHQVEGVQQLGRHRHGAVNTLAALLQALEHHQAPRQVDLLRRQGQGFGNAAASCVQHAAESADLARGLGGGGHKSAALLLGEVEAAALGVVKLHARLGLIDTVHMNSVTLSRRLKNSDIPSKHLSHRIDSSSPSRFVRHSGATIIRPPQRAELQ